nr:hypothetical protein [Tanacetum cinerariifolium]
QCTQPKRPRNATWYKDKAMLAKTQEAGHILDEEQLIFLANPGVLDGQAVKKIIPNNAAFQTDDLDTYDFDCDDVSNAKVVLMANISNYGSDVISEVPHSETYLNDMENQKTLILEEVSRSKMFKKEKDPEAINKKISNKPIDYVKLNKLYEDFGKCLVLQQELLADEAFWYHMLNPSTKSFDALPVRIKAPKKLPKVSLVNESLKKHKLHLANSNKVVKKRTTPNARTKSEWGTKIVDIAAQKPSANTIVPGMFKLDLDPLAPKLLQNREAHIDYLKYTEEQDDILRGIVK